MAAPFKRRRYLVDMGLQGRMLLAGLLHGGLVLAALLGGIFAPVVLDLAGHVLVELVLAPLAQRRKRLEAGNREQPRRDR